MRTKTLKNSLYLKNKQSNDRQADKGWISREVDFGQLHSEIVIEEKTLSFRYMGTESKKLKFQVVTYNVAELTRPDGADLTPILGLEGKPDVISIG
jgi:hypothetical protein